MLSAIQIVQWVYSEADPDHVERLLVCNKSELAIVVASSCGDIHFRNDASDVFLGPDRAGTPASPPSRLPPGGFLDKIAAETLAGQARSVLRHAQTPGGGEWLIVGCCGTYNGVATAFLVAGQVETRRACRPPRAVVVTVAALAIYAMVAAGPGSRSRTEAASPIPTRPNIVMLLADDLSLGAMDVAASLKLDDGSWFMPNFRRYILEKSIDFRQALSPNPLCCPARATLLTGQYSHNHGALSNGIRNGGALQLRDGSDRNGDGAPDGDTVARALQRAGYRTAHVGKYLNGYGLLIGAAAGEERRRAHQELAVWYGAAADVLLPEVPATLRAYEPPGWTEWYGSLDVTSYCAYNTVFSVDGKPTLFHSSGQRLDPDNLPSPLPKAGAANYQTDVIKGRALEFLEHYNSPTEPVFLSISTLVPHVEACDWSYARLGEVGPVTSGGPYPFLGNLDPPEQGGQGYPASFLDTVRPANADLVHLPRLRQVASAYLGSLPSFDEADVSDKPSFLRSKLTSMRTAYIDAPNGEAGDRYPYTLDQAFFPTPPSALNRDVSHTNPRAGAIDQFARAMATMRAFDRMIGAIAERLESQSRLSNTVFVFTSDNGYSHGHHRLSGKLLAYEESIRVPLYISLPGLTGGPIRSWGMALHTDIAPTLLDLASTPESPARFTHVPDGTSLKALLQNPAKAWRKQALVEHFDTTWPGERFSLSQHPSLFAVRTSRHNTATPNRLYTEYFTGIQYSRAGGPKGWPAGFYRSSCRPDADASACAPGEKHRVPVRPYIYTPGSSTDRLPEGEYYNLSTDQYQLTNGFGAGVPPDLSTSAAAEASALRCRLNALVTCKGQACHTAEWAATCP